MDDLLDLTDIVEEVTPEPASKQDLEDAYADGVADGELQMKVAAEDLLKAAVKKCRDGSVYRHADLIALLDSVKAL